MNNPLIHFSTRDGLGPHYYVYDVEEKEVLEGNDGKFTWKTLQDLPEEFFGSSHCYTLEECTLYTEE